jgi:phosphoribosylformylglycinamidine synthase
VTPQELEALRKDERIALRYVDGDGNRGGAPVAGPTGLEPNPNGSVDDIAGVYGGALRNVLGLMPHPERMSELALGGDDGRALFDAVLQST